jgi:hypothetical protein
MPTYSQPAPSSSQAPNPWKWLVGQCPTPADRGSDAAGCIDATATNWTMPERGRRLPAASGSGLGSQPDQSCRPAWDGTGSAGPVAAQQRALYATTAGCGNAAPMSPVLPAAATTNAWAAQSSAGRTDNLRTLTAVIDTPALHADSATCLDRRWEPGDLGSSGAERGRLARESAAVALLGCSGSRTAPRPVLLTR